ncbi:hypothetical protein [Spirulina sp. 06S082]|uniref:hypothetical protein n=1 Tax=Spirulina sp. 06S082 TaxID=3110248 RepID=UPI002B1FB62A|nr:hypothetical protein [Spirulina sp. 06S082]MEA5472516.1 hypothetical protein [Spirulina sp. 06S082]
MNNNNSLIGQITNKLQPVLEEIDQQQFQQNASQTITQENTDTNIKFLILFAFVLAGIGIAIYLLNENQPDQKQQNSSNQRRNDDVERTPRQETREMQEMTYNIILFLAVDAEDTEGIIDSLRRGQKMTPEAVNILSRTSIIQALWQGSEDQFHKTGINECFEYNSSQEPNQYDVYLIKIEIDECEREFEQDVPQTSRGRGFKRLLNKPHTITVSKRSPKESINNPNLYR